MGNDLPGHPLPQSKARANLRTWQPPEIDELFQEPAIPFAAERGPLASVKSTARSLLSWADYSITLWHAGAFVGRHASAVVKDSSRILRVVLSRPAATCASFVALATLSGCKHKSVSHLDDRCLSAMTSSRSSDGGLQILAEYCPEILPRGCPGAIESSPAPPGDLANLSEGIAMAAEIAKACFWSRCDPRGKTDATDPAKVAAVFMDVCGVGDSDLVTNEERQAITQLPPESDPSKQREHHDWVSQRLAKDVPLGTWMSAELIYLGGRDLEPEHRRQLRDFIRRTLLITALP